MTQHTYHIHIVQLLHCSPSVLVYCCRSRCSKTSQLVDSKQYRSISEEPSGQVVPVLDVMEALCLRGMYAGINNRAGGLTNTDVEVTLSGSPSLRYSRPRLQCVPPGDTFNMLVEFWQQFLEVSTVKVSSSDLNYLGERVLLAAGYVMQVLPGRS